MSTTALAELDGWLATALQALAAGERTRLFRAVGRELLKRNRQRMAAQVSPDGDAWAPRSARHNARKNHGRVRKAAAMMVKLRAARRLTADPSADGVDVGWSGASARIATVHQFGGLDYVDRQQSDKKAHYPARPLIGLDPGDLAAVHTLIIAHLSTPLP